ncbi:uncharacterized protein LOC144441152 [Glandiceps talaboti]
MLAEGSTNTPSATTTSITTHTSSTTSSYTGFFGTIGSRRLKRHRHVQHQGSSTSSPAHSTSSRNSSSDGRMVCSPSSSRTDDTEREELGCFKQCPPCPFRIPSDRKLSASLWSYEQVDRLKWKLANFPNFGDLVPSPLLPGNAVSKNQIEKFALAPVMHWLLGSGRHAGTEISTVTISQDAKARVHEILQGLDICKVAVAIREATSNIKLEDITSDYLTEICMSAQGVQPRMLPPLCILFDNWLTICQDDKRMEVALDLTVQQIMRIILSTEENLVEYTNYDIKHDKATLRQFTMCNLSNSVQCDVELWLHPRNVPFSRKCRERGSKVLVISENKLTRNGMDMAYPQMVCQFCATAKDTCFTADDHFIVYNVSACNTDTILLSRAHVCKEIVNRADKCLFDEPEFDNSYLFYYPIRYPHDRLDLHKPFYVMPIVTLYMAIMGLFLMHRECD